MKALKNYLKKYPRVRHCLKDIKATTFGMHWGLVKKGSLESALTVFVYHDVSPEPAEFSRIYNLNVSPKVFDFQMRFIKDHFQVIGPDELLNDRIPERAALITFDDGLKGVFRFAVPVLAKHGIPALFFLNMAPIIKKEIFWSGLITYLCEKQKDFISFMQARGSVVSEKAPFLACSREVVQAYLEKTGLSLADEVIAFVGDFADENDLMESSEIDVIYYGNHLYNHDVALLLAEEDLLRSYRNNEAALQGYKNYRPLFSFPFGQPSTCFLSQQVDLLMQNGAKRVFSSWPVPNRDISSPCLHRIALTDFNDTQAKVWYQIFYQELRSK
ncbi:MAG: polysaccharide deacetylase family protein [Nitrospirae bacterium]|nr:polysaccharide deacetylase family protein [Nitrospirota bacterium]